MASGAAKPVGSGAASKPAQGAEVWALRFTEALSGYMAAAEDHEAGYRAGRAAGASVRYRATVRIGDLESFLRDPQHGADMTGVVDVVGLGRGMPIEEGRIELFCRREGLPAGQAGRKTIAYHLPFRQGERRYLLRGEKHIQDDPGFDVWKDMTTLYAELLDLSSAPIGAPMAVGILRIGPLSALRMAFTFRGAGLRATANAAFRFLLFASRELRDTYGLLPW
jgi:cholesterol oxidase